MIPAATAAAESLLDPPGVRCGSCGLRVPRGNDIANSVVTVLPRMTAPAARKAATLAASLLRVPSVHQGEPNWVGISTVSMHVLDTDGHAVNRRERPSLTPALGRLVGGRAGARNVHRYKCTNREFKCLQPLKAALQKLPRRVGPGPK